MKDIRKILERLVSGKITLKDAEKELKLFSITQIEQNIAKLDIGRNLRSGIPEVVLAEGKEYSDLVKIIDGILV